MILGYSVYCCPDVDQLSAYLKAVRPEIVFGVPRVWEKIYNGVSAALAADPEKKAKFDEAVAAALAIKAAERDGTATQEQLDTWAFLDACRVRRGPRAGRARRGRRRGDRRGADPPLDRSSGSTRSACRSARSTG